MSKWASPNYGLHRRGSFLSIDRNLCGFPSMRNWSILPGAYFKGENFRVRGGSGPGRPSAARPPLYIHRLRRPCKSPVITYWRFMFLSGRLGIVTCPPDNNEERLRKHLILILWLRALSHWKGLLLPAMCVIHFCLLIQILSHSFPPFAKASRGWD